MCIQCFEKKTYPHTRLRQQWWLSCFGKGVEEKWQTCMTKFSQAWAIFRINIASTATGTGGANNSMSALPARPSAAPSKLPAEMMVWGCLCPAVRSLRLQPPCWESAAAWLPAWNVGLRAGLELPVWGSPSEGDREEVPPQYSVQCMHAGLFGPKSVTLSSLI